jgi:hypothetical protein
MQTAETDTAAAHNGLPARAAVAAPSCTTAISGQSLSANGRPRGTASYHTLCELGDAALALPVTEPEEVAA